MLHSPPMATPIGQESFQLDSFGRVRRSPTQKTGHTIDENIFLDNHHEIDPIKDQSRINQINILKDQVRELDHEQHRLTNLIQQLDHSLQHKEPIGQDTVNLNKNRNNSHTYTHTGDENSSKFNHLNSSGSEDDQTTSHIITNQTAEISKLKVKKEGKENIDICQESDTINSHPSSSSNIHRPVVATSDRLLFKNLLLGTLKHAKNDIERDIVSKNRLITAQRIDDRVALEAQQAASLKRQKQIIMHSETIAQVNKIQQETVEKQNQLAELIWEDDQEHFQLGKWLVTRTNPALYFLPSINSPIVEELYREQAKSSIKRRMIVPVKHQTGM